MKRQLTENMEDNKLHNTKLLLKKYRDVIWSLELSVQHMRNDFEKEYGSSIEDYLDTIYLAGAELSGKLEFHTKCIDQSHSMIKILNHAIGVMRSKYKHGESYYWILHYTYLCPQQLENVDEIIDSLLPHLKYISKRTYYIKCKEAVNVLSSVLWAYTSKDCESILAEFVSTANSV